MILGLEPAPFYRVQLLKRARVRLIQRGYLTVLVFDINEYIGFVNRRIRYMRYDSEYRLNRKLEINDIKETRGNIVFTI